MGPHRSRNKNRKQLKQFWMKLKEPKRKPLTKLREKFQSILKLWVKYKRKQSKQLSKSDMI